MPKPPSYVPEDFASDVLNHRADDLYFNPPCVQNEWGTAQCAGSITAFTSVQFPPFLSNCATASPWTLPFMPTCELILDGKIFGAWPRPEGMIAYQWFPHCVVRETTVGGFHIRAELFLPPECMAVAQRITVTNRQTIARTGVIGFSLHSALAKANFDINGTPRFLGAAAGEHTFDETVGDVPDLPEPLCETDNEAHGDLGRGAIRFQARHSEAWALQGFGEPGDDLPQGRQAQFAYSLEPGASRIFHYVLAIGETKDEADGLFDRIQQDFGGQFAAAKSRWTTRLNNVFTPGNPEFSGSLPDLAIADPLLRRLYHTGIATILFLRTENPNSRLGATYLAVRGQQRPARVYLWDVGCVPLSRLDPQGSKRILEAWMGAHLDRHMDIDFITGKSLENHYATNHMYLVYSAGHYLRDTGDSAWLDKEIAGRTVFQHLLDNALAWKKVRDPRTGLADYTESDLLEVVSTYDGQVAALQAGSVGAMRTMADLAESRDLPDLAADLRAEAAELAKRTIEHLYVAGEGVWRCIHRDGATPIVRHIYDSLTTLEFLGEDLGPERQAEIIAFFWRELAVDSWVHALSPADVDAYWNKRADHSWCGSYPGWPALMARCLIKYAPDARALKWIRSLGRSANQGTFGQAHMVPGAFPDENGGAQKAPLVMPLLAEWGALSGGAFVHLILDLHKNNLISEI